MSHYFQWILSRADNISGLTQAADELSEVDECISIVVKKTEEAYSQRVRVGSIGPGEE